ncbi:MAG: sensor histidine kinase [Dehalococcoidia bacterium]
MARDRSQDGVFTDRRVFIATGFVVIIFLLIAIVPLVALFAFERTADRLISDIDQLSATNASIDSAMVDQETGERGYLITRDNTFLTPYADGRAQLDAVWPRAETQARRVGGDAPALLTAEKSAAQRWQAQVGEPEVHLIQRDAAAAAVAETAFGKTVFDQFRGRSAALTAYIDRIRAGQVSGRQRLLDRIAALLVMLAILGVVGVGLLIYINNLTRGYMLQAARGEAVVRAKDEFLRLASHELKTPLTSIKGHAQLLLRQARHAPAATSLPWTADRERAIEQLTALDRQADRMTRLVRELLEASRTGSQELDLELRPVELAGLVRRIIAELQPTFPSHRLRCEAEDHGGSMTCDLDEGRIEQVLTNLIGNAVKYSPTTETANVDIHVGVEGALAVCSVTDSGIGVPEAERDRIFEPFYRASNVSSGNIGGLGVGLYLSRAIVERHGGRMWLEGAAGGGSTCCFSLPLAEA